MMGKRGPKKGSKEQPKNNDAPNPHHGKPARVTPMKNVCPKCHYHNDHHPRCPLK